MNNAGKRGRTTATGHMKKCQVSGGEIDKIIQKYCRQICVCEMLANYDIRMPLSLSLSLCKRNMEETSLCCWVLAGLVHNAD